MGIWVAGASCAVGQMGVDRRVIRPRSWIAVHTCKCLLGGSDERIKGGMSCSRLCCLFCCLESFQSSFQLFLLQETLPARSTVRLAMQCSFAASREALNALCGNTSGWTRLAMTVLRSQARHASPSIGWAMRDLHCRSQCIVRKKTYPFN